MGSLRCRWAASLKERADISSRSRPALHLVLESSGQQRITPPTSFHNPATTHSRGRIPRRFQVSPSARTFFRVGVTTGPEGGCRPRVDRYLLTPPGALLPKASGQSGGYDGRGTGRNNFKGALAGFGWCLP